MVRAGWLSIVFAFTPLVFPMAAPAHDWSRSFSTWDLTSAGARVRLSISDLELSRLLPEVIGRAGGIGGYVTSGLRMFAGDAACAVSGPARLAAAPGTAVYEWSVQCRQEEGRTIRSTLLRDVAPSHLHFVRLRLPDGAILEKVLSANESDWYLELGQSAGPNDREGASGASMASYVRLGLEHVLTGCDHVAFLLALLLLATNLGELVSVATAFTVAHSLTLGLAVLGVVHPDPGVVEALVGFSIALVAAENAWIVAGKDAGIPAAVVLALLALALLGAQGIGGVPAVTLLGLAVFSGCHFGLLRRAQRTLRLRALVAFAFGLVHGCAFAAVLGDLELPRARLVPALFGFNAGVELGQLAVIVAVWPLLQLLGRYAGGRLQRLAVEAGSAGICGLGTFWFLSRTFG